MFSTRFNDCQLELDEKQVFIKNYVPDSLPFNLIKILSKTFSLNFINTDFNNLDSLLGEKDFFDFDEKSTFTNFQIFIANIFNSAEPLDDYLSDIVEKCIDQGRNIEKIVIITFGSSEILKSLDTFNSLCKKQFAKYKCTDIYFLEGIFNKVDSIGFPIIAQEEVLAPEMLASKYDLPYYPLEWSILNCNSDRAYNICRYIKGITTYWEHIKEMASSGLDYEDIIKKMSPNIDGSKFGKQNIMSLTDQHINRLRKISDCPCHSDIL